MIRDALQPQAAAAWTDEKLHEVCLVAAGEFFVSPTEWQAKLISRHVAPLLAAERELSEKRLSSVCMVQANYARKRINELVAERDAAVKRADELCTTPVFRECEMLRADLAEARRQLAESERASGAETRRADELQRQLAETRARPLGDNHHNAWACPHCNPGGETPAALKQRAEAAEAACAAMREMVVEYMEQHGESWCAGDFVKWRCGALLNKHEAGQSILDELARLRAENALLRAVADAAEQAVRQAEASLQLHDKSAGFVTGQGTWSGIADFKTALAKLREWREKQ